MSHSSGPEDSALQAFNTARADADEAWRQAMENGHEPTLAELQMRAVLCGLEEVSVLLQDVLPNGQVSSQPLPLEENSLLTVAQVSKLLNVSRASIHRWQDSGDLPGTRTPGGERRFSKNTIRKIIDQGFEAVAQPKQQ